MKSNEYRVVDMPMWPAKQGMDLSRAWVNTLIMSRYVWTYESIGPDSIASYMLCFGEDPEMSCPGFIRFDTEGERNAFISQFKLQDQIDLFHLDGYETETIFENE